MNKSKVLILGGNGFIGSNLGDYLVKCGYMVTSFDRVLPQSKKTGIKYIVGDFFDDESLKTIIQDQDVIYHAISTLTPGNSNTEYMRGYSKDFIQTVKLCSWVEALGNKLIFLSSGGTVYGNQTHFPISEDALPSPINHYGNLKLCIENTMRIFNTQEQAHMIIARISNPYGPGQDYKKGVGFIDAVLKKSISHESVEIWGDGNVIRDYIYIEDVCKVLEFLAHYEGSECVFNIGSGEGASQNRILEIVKELAPDIQVQYKPYRSVDVKKVILDCNKIKCFYDEPLLGIKEGIYKYYNALVAEQHEYMGKH